MDSAGGCRRDAHKAASKDEVTLLVADWRGHCESRQAPELILKPTEESELERASVSTDKILVPKVGDA